VPAFGVPAIILCRRRREAPVPPQQRCFGTHRKDHLSNKLVKGSLAAAVGVALLMGGAGTLASWNDTSVIAGGTITAGTLSITVPGSTPASDGWKSGSTAIPNIATYRIVPGDTLTYQKTFIVTATGDSLTATASLGALSITGASQGAADVALAALLTKSAVFTVDGVTTATVTGSASPKTVVVTATIAFPSGTTTTDNAAKLGVVSLAAFNLTLTQN
jgi:alternate signal-mediated exported protein